VTQYYLPLMLGM